MEKKCLSCRNGFCFYNNQCHCFLEPSNNTHNDDYWCYNYEPVDEVLYNERVNWKEREEREKEIENL